jgi:hypothetical protein
MTLRLFDFTSEAPLPDSENHRTAIVASLGERAFPIVTTTGTLAPGATFCGILALI